MSALTLYQLTGQFRELEALADSDDLPPEVIRDTLEGLTGELEVKAISVAAFTRNLEASADMIDEAAKAMQTRARRLRAPVGAGPGARQGARAGHRPQGARPGARASSPRCS